MGISANFESKGELDNYFHSRNITTRISLFCLGIEYADCAVEFHIGMAVTVEIGVTLLLGCWLFTDFPVLPCYLIRSNDNRVCMVRTL